MSEYVAPQWMLVLHRLVVLHRSGPCKALGGVPFGPQVESNIQVVDLEGALRSWRAFGEAIGIDEGAYRKKDAEHRQIVADGLVGCSWFKCPLYRTELESLGRSPLTCSRCKLVSGHFPRSPSLLSESFALLLQAQYCGFNCQRR